MKPNQLIINWHLAPANNQFGAQGAQNQAVTAQCQAPHARRAIKPRELPRQWHKLANMRNICHLDSSQCTRTGTVHSFGCLVL